jgi:rubrerythrin
MMSKRLKLVLLAAALLCSAFLLSACNKNTNKKFIDQETYNLMKQTQSELSACAERCRDAARGGYADSYFLRALANSQEILAQRHETILAVTRRKFNLQGFNAVVEPSTIRVMTAPEGYEQILLRPDNSTMPPEVLITLEVTNKVLKQDGWLESTQENSFRGLENLHICTVCGLLTEGEVENCPVCNSAGERVVKLDSRGEIPAAEKGSYVIRKD